MSKPSVLICGGLHSGARPLTSYIVKNNLVSHVRVADKYSVAPPTTYLGSEFPKLLENPVVDYRQANLTKEGPVTNIFDPPEGIEPYSYIFDFTGQIDVSRPAELQIGHTAVPAYLLGKEASKRKLKAYIRVTQPYYQTSLEKTAHEEGEVLKPTEPCGTWYHEALRILANFEELPLVIIRHGCIYGPWIVNSMVTKLILLGLVYQELNEEFKNLWSKGVRNNTVHCDDVAGACWAAAEWISPLGRAQANKLAGEDIYFSNDKAYVGQVQGMPDQKVKLTAPLFNLVDDTDTKLETLTNMLTTIFGIKAGFHSFIHNTLAQMKLEEALEEINEVHMEAWNRLVAKADPPVPNTPLNPYMEAFMLEKRSLAFKGGKFQRIVGYQLKHPQFNEETVRGMINSFKEDGSWPNVPGR